jgi:hypothetical protein
MGRSTSGAPDRPPRTGTGGPAIRTASAVSRTSRSSRLRSTPALRSGSTRTTTEAAMACSESSSSTQSRSRRRSRSSAGG